MDAELVSLRTAVDWFPHKGGRKPSVASLQTWVETGRNGVFLKATSSGGQWFTTREWVETFLLESDSPSKPKAGPKPGTSPKSKAKPKAARGRQAKT